jgi:hypothetical protein
MMQVLAGKKKGFTILFFKGLNPEINLGRLDSSSKWRSPILYGSSADNLTLSRQISNLLNLLTLSYSPMGSPALAVFRHQ